MSDFSRMLAMAPCWRCRQPFSFDPDEVPSVVTDGPGGEPVPQGGPVPADPVRQPLCGSCADRIEAVRASMGLAKAWPRR